MPRYLLWLAFLTSVMLLASHSFVKAHEKYPWGVRTAHPSVRCANRSIESYSNLVHTRESWCA